MKKNRIRKLNTFTLAPETKVWLKEIKKYYKINRSRAVDKAVKELYEKLVKL